MKGWAKSEQGERERERERERETQAEGVCLSWWCRLAPSPWPLFRGVGGLETTNPNYTMLPSILEIGMPLKNKDRDPGDQVSVIVCYLRLEPRHDRSLWQFTLSKGTQRATGGGRQ